MMLNKREVRIVEILVKFFFASLSKHKTRSILFNTKQKS